MDMDLQYTKDSVDKIIERAIDFRMPVRLKDGVPEVLEEVSRDAPIGGGGIANNLNYAVRGTVVVVAVVIVAAAVVGAATYVTVAITVIVPPRESGSRALGFPTVARARATPGARKAFARSLIYDIFIAVPRVTAVASAVAAVAVPRASSGRAIAF